MPAQTQPARREMSRPTFPAAVHTYTDALRVLRDVADPLSAAEIAERTDRVPSNVRRDLPKLRDAGVVAFAGGDDSWRLTDKGRAWLAGMAVAEGEEAAGSAPEGFVLLRHGEISPDLSNARRDWSSEEARRALKELRASIAAHGLLQPLVVRRAAWEDTVVVGADSARRGWLLIAGERRWRAIGEAINAGEWPADQAIPCRAVTADALQHRLAALAENLQRRSLNPIEEARAFAGLREAGLDTDDIATRVAVSLRQVQMRLQLLQLSEADQDRLTLPASDPNHLSVTAARALVQTPKSAAPAEADPDQQLIFPAEAEAETDADSLNQPGPVARQALAELAHKLANAGGSNASIRPEAEADPAFQWLELRRMIVVSHGPRRGEIRARPSDAGAEFVRLNGPWLGGAIARYATEWLNADGGETVEPSPATVSATDEPDQSSLTLSPRMATAILELGHKIEEHGAQLPSGERGTAVGAHWSHTTATEAVQRRLVQFVMPSPAAGWHATLTEVGEEACAALREQGAGPISGPPYATPWLNLAAPVAPPAPEITPEQANADAVLEAVLAGATEPHSVEGFRELLTLAGLTGPFDADGDAGSVFMSNSREVATADVNRELPDALAQARAALIARALNLCAGLAAGPTPSTPES